MSVDQRLRNGLHSSVARLDPDHQAPLLRVQARARRATHAARWLRGTLALAATVAAVAVLPPVVDRLPAPTPPAVVVDDDDDLAGTYVADVADAADTRSTQLAGRWVITFEENGVLAINPPPGYAGTTAGTAYEVDGHTLRSDALIDHPGCQRTGTTNVGTYQWQLEDDQLHFSVVSDDCQARVVLLTGQDWTAVS